MSPVASKVADFARSLSIDDVPVDVVDRVKALALDCIGIALAAADTPVPNAGIRALGEMGASGNGECRVLVSGELASPHDAALANGLLVGGLDWDDTHLQGAHHVSASAFPATLAVSEAARVSGVEFLMGYLLALEFSSRTAAAAADGIHQRGFAPTGAAAAMGCSAANCKILGGSSEEIVWAQGIAGSMASGLLEFLTDGSWTKNIHGAWAAHCSVVAAYLAREGFTGPSTIYDGDCGFYATHLEDHSVQFIPEMFDTLGHVWEVNNIAGKRYPVCHFSQAILDAWFELRDKYNLEYSNIAQITCRVPAGAIPTICEPVARRTAPVNGHDAQESLQYVLAAAICHGEITHSQLGDDAVNDSSILEVAKTIHYEVDENSKFPKEYDGDLVIDLKDGGVLSCRRSAESLTVDDFREKFIEIASGTIGEAKAHQIMNTVFRLEDLSDISELTAMLID